MNPSPEWTERIDAWCAVLSSCSSARQQERFGSDTASRQEAVRGRTMYCELQHHRLLP